MDAGTDVTASAPPEGLFESVVDASDDAIFTCAMDGTIASWSLTAVRLFGREAEDVLDEPLPDLFPEHVRDEIRSVVARVGAGDRIRHVEIEVLRPDGMPMPVSLSVCPVAAHDDGIACAVVVVKDVTERRVAQAVLAEAETRLQEAEALAHVGSWLWDLRTGAVQWSAEFYRIHRIEPLDFAGTLESYLAVVHAADRERLRDAMQQSVVTGRSLEEEYRVVLPDGTARTVHVQAQPTFGSAGDAIGLRGIGFDVADRTAR